MKSVQIISKKDIGLHQTFSTNVKDNYNYITDNNIINHNCVVDEDYAGIVHAHLFNIGKKPIDIKKGDKIVQAVIRRVEKPIMIEGKVKIEGLRGEGGFGSTGDKAKEVPIANESLTENTPIEDKTQTWKNINKAKKALSALSTPIVEEEKTNFVVTSKGEKAPKKKINRKKS